MDELQSVGVGIALGLVLVSFFALYPGQPFDYTTDNVEVCRSNISSSPNAVNSSNDPNLSNTSSEIHDDITNDQQQQIAHIERAAQRVRIQKLQELLGLEKEKAQRLVQRAKEEAIYAVGANNESSSSYSASGNSAWLDRIFFAFMFILLWWVLWQDYSINLFSVAANLLPREAEVVRQVVAAPRVLLAQAAALWE
ncbi:unnamed protein product [Phytophthora lilii]|uniref:Unnamed protein product n=1 Tax=Phytophthora lilii TaxID=2077276 RepID=A0A9W6TWT2_9STRA|nr:unnamed protein product [Phytophthora lilii]